jgi:hypothetical protein
MSWPVILFREETRGSLPMIAPPVGSREGKFLALFFAAIGLLVGGMLAKDARRAWESRAWPSVPCTIVASGVQEQGGETPYRLHVLFRYEWQGRRYVSQSYRERPQTSADIAEVERLARAYPVDARRSCFVDPVDPSRAVLVRESIWEPVLVIAFFALLVAFLVKIYLFPGRRSAGSPALGDLPVGKPGAVLLCLFVTSLGTAAFAWITALPVARTVAAMSWTPTPCTVASSQVRTKVTGGEHHIVTWWPDVVFRYRVNGRDYRSNIVNLTDLPTPWYYGERGIAARYAPGAAAPCFVNPEDPSEAVLERDLSVDLWLGVWPLIMAVAGAAGMVEVATGRKVRCGRPQDWARLGLWAALWFALVVLGATGSDLVRDWRAGRADGIEAAVVSLAAVVAAIPAAALTGFARWTLRTGRSSRGSMGPTPGVIRTRDRPCP